MYAVVQSGGRQHKVEVGSMVDVDFLDAEVGSSVELDKVLLLSTDDGVTVGQPTVEGARVVATVVEEIRGKKIIVFKYKPKVRYRRKNGHRQDYTRLEVKDIVTSAGSAGEVARSDVEGNG